MMGNTHPVVRHLGTKRLVHIIVYLASRIVRQVPRYGVFGELELGPDHEMDNSGVDSIRPVVVQDLQVLFDLERAPLGTNGLGPMKALSHDEVHNAPIILAQLRQKMAIASQFRRYPLEEIQSVRSHAFLHLRPCENVVFVVGRAEDADVLGAEVLEEFGARFRPVLLGDVNLPVRQVICLLHLVRWLVWRWYWLVVGVVVRGGERRSWLGLSGEGSMSPSESEHRQTKGEYSQKRFICSRSSFLSQVL